MAEPVHTLGNRFPRTRHSQRFSALTLAILFLLAGIFPVDAQIQISPDQRQRITEDIQLLIREGASPNAIWSVSVRDLDGNELIGINQSTLVRPASNMKLLSGGAILETLGGDFRFQTRIKGRGVLEEGVWKGDIIVFGSGDPSIDGKRYRGDRLKVMVELVEQLRWAGIHRVEGDLIADVSMFSDEPYPKGWEWDDLSFYYAPELSALSFNGNCVDLTVKAGSQPGSVPVISWFPYNTDYITFVNDQRVTVPGSRYVEWYRRMPGSSEIHLRSTMPPEYVEEECLTVPNPALFFLDTFRRTAQSRNIDWTGTMRVSRESLDGPELTPLAVHTSDPTRFLVEILNKDSDNFYTEMLLRAAVFHRFGLQASTDTANDLLQKFLISNGFTVSNLYVKDGSGLASVNLISTGEMTNYLHLVRSKPWFTDFNRSLSLAGRDGNYRFRFTRAPIAGNMVGKSGFISGVRANSGYLTTKGNHTLIFSIITNNYPVRTALIDATHQSILELLYNNF